MSQKSSGVGGSSKTSRPSEVQTEGQFEGRTVSQGVGSKQQTNNLSRPSNIPGKTVLEREVEQRPSHENTASSRFLQKSLNQANREAKQQNESWGASDNYSDNFSHANTSRTQGKNAQQPNRGEVRNPQSQTSQQSFLEKSLNQANREAKQQNESWGASDNYSDNFSHANTSRTQGNNAQQQPNRGEVRNPQSQKPLTQVNNAQQPTRPEVRNTQSQSPAPTQGISERRAILQQQQTDSESKANLCKILTFVFGITIIFGLIFGGLWAYYNSQAKDAAQQLANLS